MFEHMTIFHDWISWLDLIDTITWFDFMSSILWYDLIIPVIWFVLISLIYLFDLITLDRTVLPFASLWKVVKYSNNHIPKNIIG